MIAADSSALARFFDGLIDPATAAVRTALATNRLHVPAVVITEVLSNPEITAEAIRLVAILPQLKITHGFWQRAGDLRRGLLAVRLRAGLADCLIAQSCIDNDVPLITYDRDFRHFEPAGLTLA